MNNLRDSPIDGKFALLEHARMIGFFSTPRVKKGLYRGEIPLLMTQSHLVNVKQAAHPVMALHPYRKVQTSSNSFKGEISNTICMKFHKK
jgi:hypothetical protein